MKPCCSDLLYSAADYIDVLERKISSRFNPWNKVNNPTEMEISGKKGVWLANKSIAELKIGKRR